MKIIDIESIEYVNKLEEKLNYKFKNIDLLLSAITHTSFANEYIQKKGVQVEHNERMEFLGDSILSTSISSYIYKNYPQFSEGQLSKLRAVLVCEASLAELANNLDLSDYLLLGIGEKATGGANKTSILSDAYESIIGAIFLDSNYERANEYILLKMENDIKLKVKNFYNTDYKTNLQELIQKDGKTQVKYDIIASQGPCHDKTYTAQVIVSDGRAGTGEGKTKKDAEQNAARDFLSKEIR